jgi:hypothetical protein
MLSPEHKESRITLVGDLITIVTTLSLEMRLGAVCTTHSLNGSHVSENPNYLLGNKNSYWTREGNILENGHETADLFCISPHQHSSHWCLNSTLPNTM